MTKVGKKMKTWQRRREKMEENERELQNIK